MAQKKRKSVKKAEKADTTKKRGRGRPKKSVEAKSKSNSKTSKPKSKRYQKKRGRKPTSLNRYNSIKAAISDYYLSSVGRKIKRYELKIIYQWVKSNYGNQSLRYVLMNIDVILDNFWQEYCNLYPVNLENHARFFDWYYFKNYLYEEVEYHYPSDIISVDLSQIGEDTFEFFMEDYAEKVEELYMIGKAAGLKTMSGVYPKYYLQSAYCDVARKGNVYNYILLVDGEIPEMPTATIPTTTPPTTEQPTTPTEPIAPPTAPTPTTEQPTPPTETVGKPTDTAEKIKEIRLLIAELREDLKNELITKEEYYQLVKGLMG